MTVPQAAASPLAREGCDAARSRVLNVFRGKLMRLKIAPTISPPRSTSYVRTGYCDRNDDDIPFPLSRDHRSPFHVEVIGLPFLSVIAFHCVGSVGAEYGNRFR